MFSKTVINYHELPYELARGSHGSEIGMKLREKDHPKGVDEWQGCSLSMHPSGALLLSLSHTLSKVARVRGFGGPDGAAILH